MGMGAYGGRGGEVFAHSRFKGGAVYGPEQQVLALDLRSMASGGSDSGRSLPVREPWVVLVRVGVDKSQRLR